MADTLELLLKCNTAELPKKELRMKRLSEAAGGDVVFSIQAINFNEGSEIKGRKSEDIPLFVILEGVVSPDLKNAELMKKYKAATPIEMLKELLLPGEIEDLSREIETLSGYRGSTVEEIKKK